MRSTQRTIGLTAALLALAAGASSAEPTYPTTGTVTATANVRVASSGTAKVKYQLRVGDKVPLIGETRKFYIIYPNSASVPLFVAKSLVNVPGGVTAAAKSAPSPRATAPTPAHSWVSVLHMDGNGQQNSDPFTVSTAGGYWYISYSTQDMQAGDTSLPGNFAIQLKKPSNDDFEKLLVDTMGAKTGTTDVYTAGTFYLEIDADEPFSLDVYDWE